jgi:hypothetical protein
MNLLYTIHYKHKQTGQEGSGKKYFEKELAIAIVDELNQEYPALHHYMEPVLEEGKAGEESSPNVTETITTETQSITITKT